MSAPLYTRDILRLAASVPNVGALAEPDGTADLRSPACGSRIQVSVELDAEGKVVALSQQVQACAFAQASAALMGQHAVGRSRQEVADGLEQLTNWLLRSADQPGTWPGLQLLAPARAHAGRHAAILLPFRTLLAALDSALSRRPSPSAAARR